MDEGAYEPTLLKGDNLHYCQGCINQLKEVDKLVTNLFHSALLRDKDCKDQGLQPGDLVYWTRYQIKGFL